MRPSPLNAWPQTRRERYKNTNGANRALRGLGTNIAGRGEESANEKETTRPGGDAVDDEYDDEDPGIEDYNEVKDTIHKHSSVRDLARGKIEEPRTSSIRGFYNPKEPDSTSLPEQHSPQFQERHKIPQQIPSASQPDIQPVLQQLHQKGLQNLTISDDRSVGSDFERNHRILQALKPKANHRILPIPKAEENSTSNSEEDIVPPVATASDDLPTGRSGGNHALQDYQMQLMLLEQQNKKRLMRARQEQDNMPLPTPGPPRINLPISSSLDDILDISSDPPPVPSPNQQAFALDLPPSTVMTDVQVRSTNEPASNVLFTGNNTQSSRLRLSMDSKGYRRSDIAKPGNKSQLNVFPQTGTTSVGVPNLSALSLEGLQDYTRNLQQKVVGLERLLKEQEPCRFQIIHRITHAESKSLYFDKPQWFVGEDSSLALRSNLPLSNVSTFLDKHPDVSFVIFRDYYWDSRRHEKSAQGRDSVPEVRHTEEHIYTSAKDLTSGVTKFLKSNPNFLDIYTDFKSKQILDAPYFTFYHTRRDMENVLNELSDKQQRQFKLLYDYILSDYGAVYQEVGSLLERGKITSKYIKYLFKSGDILVEGQGDDIRGVLAESWLEYDLGYLPPSRKNPINEKRIERWNITTSSWRFNGVFSHLIEEMHVEIDRKEDSEISIESLNLRPLAFMSEHYAGRLRRRGEMFWKCRDRHFVSHHEDKGRESHHAGDERYMIDLKTYSKLHPPDTTKNSYRKEEYNDDLGTEVMKRDIPPDSNFVYLVPVKIKAYSLKLKKWVDLRVDRLSEVVWNKEAFKSLVLDNKTKNLIQALISNQLEAENSTDLISGKGNGLILLLHGGPGTGKTLTAESVAEIAEKPLYPVTCGDIGTDPEQVEVYLESVFNLGKAWDCVVLLDEADVFLEQRSLADLQRNALVSVFLRVLEYHDGILVLTSNRVGTFDEAFKSRIQLALHYANLSSYQREKIWRNFFDRLRKLNVEKVDYDDLEDHLEHLSKIKMNGRQIRNAITTARQYAKWKEETLNYAILKDIVETSGRFDVYLEKLNGGYSQDQLAEDEGVRLSETAESGRP